MKYKRIILFVLIFALTIFLVYEAIASQFPELWRAFTSGDEESLEAFLSDSDRYTGLIFLALLQFVQVISIVIPSAPIQIAGGMVYGAARAYLVCQITYVLANVAVFAAVRRFSGLNELLGGSEHGGVQKAMKFINRGDPFVTVMLLCLIPLIPNGSIPYAASQMNLKTRSFALAVLTGSVYPIVSMVLAGKFLVSGDYIVSILLTVANIVVVLIVYRFRDRISDFLTRHIRHRVKEQQIE